MDDFIFMLLWISLYNTYNAFTIKIAIINIKWRQRLLTLFQGVHLFNLFFECTLDKNHNSIFFFEGKEENLLWRPKIWIIPKLGNMGLSTLQLLTMAPIFTKLKTP